MRWVCGECGTSYPTVEEVCLCGGSVSEMPSLCRCKHPYIDHETWANIDSRYPFADESDSHGIRCTKCRCTLELVL